MERIRRFKRHLEPNKTDAVATRRNEMSENAFLRSGMFENKLTLESRRRMMKDIPNDIDTFENEITRVQKYGQKGHLFIYWEQLASKYSSENGGDGYSNIGIPLTFIRKGGQPYIDFTVILGNYKDAKRIAEKHVKKSELYQTTFLADGVLGTNDNEMWQHQRKNLSEAFLPQTNLQRVFPVSRNRAEYAVTQILAKQIGSQGPLVEINEFLLFEAMAQLQLALFGETEEKMKEWNSHIRQSFNASMVSRNKDMNGDYIQTDSVNTLIRRRRIAMRQIKDFTKEVMERGAERVKSKEAGPVMENLVNMCPFTKKQNSMKRDTASTFLFAGHDTTANLMTHFLYEMSRNPQWMAKVQVEVDAMFDKAAAEGRKVEYNDLKSLMVMKRCINETLRLWPSVPNGTIREFEEDDYIQGYGNEQVKVDKGVQMFIPVWLLHRNPELWENADKFCPDRKWLPAEDWYGEGLSGLNPASHRFCPFTFKPRDCMGRNFAQMEARLILASVLRMYDVLPSEQTKNANLLDLVANFGTLGAKNGLYLNFVQRKQQLY